MLPHLEVEINTQSQRFAIRASRSRTSASPNAGTRAARRWRGFPGSTRPQHRGPAARRAQLLGAAFITAELPATARRRSFRRAAGARCRVGGWLVFVRSLPHSTPSWPRTPVVLAPAPLAVAQDQRQEHGHCEPQPAIDVPIDRRISDGVTLVSNQECRVAGRDRRALRLPEPHVEDFE